MIVFLFLSLYISQYYIPYDMPILYGVSLEIMLIILCINGFIKSDYRKPIEKSGWFCAVSLTIINVLFFTWFEDVNTLSIELAILETIAFISMYIYSQYRNYDIKSDEYNKKDTFIILKRPDNFKEYLISCVLIPVSSMSVVSKGKWYRFKREEPFTMADYTEDDRHIYIKANVEDVKKKLKPFIGNEWTRKQNCCHIIQKLFDIKFSIFDSIPAYMAHKIIKTRADNDC